MALFLFKLWKFQHIVWRMQTILYRCSTDSFS